MPIAPHCAASGLRPPAARRFFRPALFFLLALIFLPALVKMRGAFATAKRDDGPSSRQRYARVEP